MILSLVLFLFFPILDSGIRYVRVNFFFHKFVFWLFFFNFCFLGFLGSQTAEHPTAIMGQICTGIHVCYVFVYLTIATSFESHLMIVNEPLVPSFVSSKPLSVLDQLLYQLNPSHSKFKKKNQKEYVFKNVSADVLEKIPSDSTTPEFEIVDYTKNLYAFKDYRKVLNSMPTIDIEKKI